MKILSEDSYTYTYDGNTVSIDSAYLVERAMRVSLDFFDELSFKFVRLEGPPHVTCKESLPNNITITVSWPMRKREWL